MRKKAGIFGAVVTLFLGVATAALAYTHSGPFYTAAYNVNVWNYGLGVGPVSSTNQTSDQISIPAGIAGAFLDDALLDWGTCLECVGWVPGNGGTALIQVGTDAYASSKVTTGVSTRFFTLSGNLGSPQTNTRVTGEYLCGTHQFYYSTPVDYACLSQLGAGTYSWRGDALNPTFNNTAPYTDQPYSTLSFTTTTCTMSGNTITAMTMVIDPADAGVGADANGKTCATDIFSAYTALGGTTAGSGGGGSVISGWDMGGLHMFTYKMDATNCLTAENNEWGAHSNTGTHCYIAFATHDKLAALLEHTPPIAWGAQTSTLALTLSPALTTAPTATNLSRVRTLVDTHQSSAVTQEWNCLLDLTYVACPSVAPPPVPAGCFNAPEPGASESYADYKLRIQNDGYVGTFVETNDPNYPVGGAGYPDHSDAAVLSAGTSTGVGSLGGSGSVTMAYVSSTGKRVAASAWRGAAICPDTTTEVDIYDVPSGGTSGTGGGSSTLPSLDFSPITSVSYGSAFPFGIFSWVTDVFATGNCDSTHGGCNHPPGFTLTKPAGGTIFIDLSNSAWVDTYRQPVFDTIDFLLVIAAVWFLAMRVIGIGGGDGGDDEE